MTQLFETAFIEAHDATLIVDEQGCIVRANRGCQALLEYAEAELEGQPASERAGPGL